MPAVEMACVVWMFPGDIASATALLWAGALLIPWLSALFIPPGVFFDLVFQLLVQNRSSRLALLSIFMSRFYLFSTSFLSPKPHQEGCGWH